MKGYEEKLVEAGLTGNEAKVYLELLKKGELSANHISKNLSMDRTLSYSVLNSLIDKGQVGHIIKENKKFFSCSNPDNLLNPIKAKEIFVKDLIKELSEIKTEKEEDLIINVYEGKEGIRTFINLASKQAYFYAFGSTGLAFFSLYEMPAIAKRLERAKIDVKIIGNKKYKGTEPFNFQKFKYKYLDIDSKATTSIFGDRIAIHQIRDKPFIIVIKNKDIAESYKNHFNKLWEVAKK